MWHLSRLNYLKKYLTVFIKENFLSLIKNIPSDRAETFFDKSTSIIKIDNY